MRLERCLWVSSILLVGVGCQSSGGDGEAPPNVSAVFEDNGSWGNGSWGNGSWGNGSWGNGSWGNGTWGNGSWGNGTWGNGSWGNGTWGNGTWGNGTWGNGSWGNGSWGNGTWGNGSWGNGSWGNGTWGNGTWGNGMLFDTLAVASLDLSNLNDTALSGAACGTSPDRSAAMTELMVYVAAIQCALPAPCAENDTVCQSQIDCASDPNCRVITDCDGNELYVSGRDGLGTDQSDPSVVSAVDACLDATLLELNTEFRAYADNLNQYSVSCALPASTGGDCSTDPGCAEVTYQLYPSGTETKQYYGAIGLAPTWKNNPDFDLDPVGQRRVSACLASRTNPDRKKVQISLRGMGVPTTETERNVYRHHEGAFWGNMFDANPEIHTCTVNGNGPSGRVCTGGQCNFIDEGPCVFACTDVDAEGNYTNCGVENSTEVVNIFLPLNRTMSSGYYDACAIRSGGVWCWGGDYLAGTASALPEQVPVFTAPPEEISVIRNHTCARKSDGTLWCWGLNSYMQSAEIPVDQIDEPTQFIAVGSDVAQIAESGANARHTCAIKTSGAVWCWGDDDDGQLGNGASSLTWPAEVVGLTGAVKVTLGAYFSCALKNDGTVWCWGNNALGELGIGTSGNGESQFFQTPVQTAVTEAAIDLCSGSTHSCVITEDRGVQCWGRNNAGQIGGAETYLSTHSGAPLDIVGLPTGASDVVCGHKHTCALLEDGSVWCWGHNNYGQVGHNDMSVFHSTPVAVQGLGTMSHLVAAEEHTCASAPDGAVWCWGRNTSGNLGFGPTSMLDQNPVPGRVTIFDNCGDGICDFAESALDCSADCCMPVTCGANSCGLVADGCGGTLNCGACTGSGTVEVRISIGQGDMEENLNTGHVSGASSDLELGYDGSKPQLAALRFPGLDVPPGATITSAYVEFEVDEVTTGAASFVIEGQATDDAAALVASNSNLSGRSRTSASVAWVPEPWSTKSAKHNSSDFSSVVQEIVNRSGWQSGNALVLFITGTGTRTAEAYNGEAANAPLLHIEYSY